MTFDAEFRNWLYRRYSRAWKQSTRPQNKPKKQWAGKKTSTPANSSTTYTPVKDTVTGKTTIPMVEWDDFSMSSVLFIDATHKLKFNYFNKGISFIQHILKEVNAFLQNEYTNGAYLCFDILPRQINKQFFKEPSTSSKKTKPRPIPMTTVSKDEVTASMINTAKMARKVQWDKNEDEKEEKDNDDGYDSDTLIAEKYFTVVDDNLPLIDDDSCPTMDEWNAFRANKYLFPEIIHYITDRIINPQPDPLKTFNVPYNKFLYLWGGNLFIPPKRSERVKASFSEIEAITYENSVFYVGNTFDTLTHQFTRECGRTAPSNFNIATLTNLKEADLSLMHFLTYHEREDVTVLSGDGDLILILLLACKNRIDENGKWKNTVYFRYNTNQKSSDGIALVQEININILFEMIMADPTLNMKKGVSDPVLQLCLISTLIENDYIPNYMYGVSSVKVDEKGKTIYRGDDATNTESIPTLIQTFLLNPTKYSKMAYFCSDHHGYGAVVPIRIDETIFNSFVKDCYLTQYKSFCANKMKKDINTVTIKDIRHYLYKLRSKEVTEKTIKSRLLTDREIRVFSRNALWTINYMKNTYLVDGLFPGSPLKLIGGYPFYGYGLVSQKNGKPKCVKATVVPKWVSLDLKYVSTKFLSIKELLNEQDEAILAPTEEDNLEPPKKKRRLLTSKTSSFEDYEEIVQEDNIGVVGINKNQILHEVGQHSSILNPKKITRVNVEKL